MIKILNRNASFIDKKDGNKVKEYTEYYTPLNLGKFTHDLIIKFESKNDKTIVNMSAYTYITIEASKTNSDYINVIANCVLSEDSCIPILLKLDNNQKALIRLAMAIEQ